MTYKTVSALEVSIWSKRVGALARNPRTGYYAFEYDPTWIEGAIELAPLHMPNLPGVYEFRELDRATYHALPAMIADALPDRFGTALVTRWLEEHGVAPEQITALDRLSYAGSRAMGALTFAPPSGPETSEPTLIQVARLVTAAQSSLHGTLMDASLYDALHELITVGSTAGGARAKAVIAFNPTTYEMLSGQFDAPPGFEQWLIKLDGVGATPSQHNVTFTGTEPYCRIEYAYYLMAREAGITMSESRLLLEGPRAHFLTKRFDRENNQKIHTQTLCALAHLDYLLPRTHSYERYFATARALGLGPDAMQEIFRRALFNVAGVNRDDHTKNASFLLPENGSWQLAPAYDLTHSHWDEEWAQAQQLSVNGKFTDITLDDFKRMGEAVGVPSVDAAIDEVNTAIDAWPDFAKAAGLDAQNLQRIADDIEQLRPR